MTRSALAAVLLSILAGCSSSSSSNTVPPPVGVDRHPLLTR
jgi:hypothetical protein